MPGSQSIAFVCPRFAEEKTVGGAETLLKHLAQRLVRCGRRVTFLTTCAKDHFTWANEMPPGSRMVDGLSVIRFPVDSDRDVGTFLRIQRAISRGARVTREQEALWLANSVNSRELCEHLRHHAEDYDRVVVGPYLFGLSYAAAKTLPDKSLLVPCLHDEPFAYLDAFRELFPTVRGVLFNSAPERDLGFRLYSINPERTAVVGMGMEPFDADPERFRSLHGIAEPYIIYCGRREPLKGTPLLIDYVAAYRSRNKQKVELILTGGGPVDVPSELQPHVHDLGFVSEQVMHDAMAGAVAFCHPSINESLGIVILESWLAGTPALVHAGSAVLRDQCLRSNGGLWFRSYPEFEESLKGLLANPRMRDILGKQGSTFVRREYAWDRIEEKLLQAFDKI